MVLRVTAVYLLMKHIRRFSFVIMLNALIFSGCGTFEQTRSAGDFVRSTNFSPLDTFSYRETILSGMALREDQDQGLLEISGRVLSDELTARGFEAMESDADFYVLARWDKAISSSGGIFDSVDGPSATMARSSYNASKAAVRFTLTVELYETGTNDLFWRAELPNVFDAIQYTDERVELSLVRAIQNFPQRIEKDPNLPNIE